MHYFRPALFLVLLPVPVIVQQEPPAPLVVGQTIQDAIVAPLAQFANHGWQSVPEDSSGLPPLSSPFYWYQLTASGKPLVFHRISTVKVLEGTWEDPYWVAGLLIQAQEDSLQDKRVPFRGQVLVDSLVPGGVFVIDSSVTTRTRVLSLLKRVFPDSFAVPDVTGRSKDLLRGSAPVGRVTVQRLSPVARGNAALMLVEAERCVRAGRPNDCGDSQLIDLWLLDHGSRYQVLNQRGPINSDTDFKSGSGLSARAWLFFRSSSHGRSPGPPEWAGVLGGSMVSSQAIYITTAGPREGSRVVRGIRGATAADARCVRPQPAIACGRGVLGASFLYEFSRLRFFASQPGRTYPARRRALGQPGVGGVADLG